MTRAEKAHDYLAKHPGEPFCDQCLAHRVGEPVSVLSQTVQNLGVLFHRGVRRGADKCSVCGNEKDATAFVAERANAPSVGTKEAPRLLLLDH